MPKALKIGFVIDTSLDTTEGVPQYVLTMGEWLRHQGHEVHYLAGETHRQDLPNMHSLAKNIKVRFNGTTTTIPLPTSRRRLRAFINAENFDILHVQTPHHPLMAQRLVLAADSKTAVIATFHVMPYGRLSRWGTRLLGLWLRPSLQRINAMLAVSSVAAEYERWAFGLPAVISPNVIDYRLFNQAKPLAEYGDSTLTILYLGRLVPRKGCQLLLSAVAELVESGESLPKFRVLICSDGPLRPQLEAFSREHKLQDIITFTGFIDEADKPRYYASADIAVFPSSGGESFGIVLVEAMASGQAAVLGGDNSGYRSVLEKRPELLFKTDNPAILTDKLRYFLTDSKDRQAAATWGLQHSKQFDVAAVGTQLVEIYRKALREQQ